MYVIYQSLSFQIQISCPFKILFFTKANFNKKSEDFSNPYQKKSKKMSNNDELVDYEEDAEAVIDGKEAGKDVKK